ncbi:hypothetical protein K2F43_14940 [Clostridium estertheticum]|uniref:hypothetical protein n=1 Tax=Clostridium estertheticum TaxID=238834 RepID=UPI001C6F2C82|nr:hypothetical protein [Clostridium estertheticum]MBW9172502.1 hypothetical protein [Clostridium estertheticum]WLC76541.1 hypothetical protein KTC99_06980 [Clostridium estertheticum]
MFNTSDIADIITALLSTCPTIREVGKVAEDDEIEEETEIEKVNESDSGEKIS